MKNTLERFGYTFAGDPSSPLRHGFIFVNDRERCFIDVRIKENKIIKQTFGYENISLTVDELLAIFELVLGAAIDAGGRDWLFQNGI